MSRPVTFDVVVPTIGRPSLQALLAALSTSTGPATEHLIIVDDRRTPPGPPDIAAAGVLKQRIVVLHSGGRGPAAARNVGWWAARSEWVAFLDDDVLPPPSWTADLVRDLEQADRLAGSAGRISVPLPMDRPATDWERNVAALGQARWATADMAYRRRALEVVGGFNEAFPRAFREDADIALRMQAAGFALGYGTRLVEHPVRPAGRWISVRLQAGNADDATMRALYGPHWRARADVPAGRRRWHLATTAAGAGALLAALAGRRRPAGVLAAAWAAFTADFAWRRIAPGPKGRAEISTMLATSAAIPPAASWHWLRGTLRARRTPLRTHPAPARPAALLVDRDGTLVHDVPYNRSPDLVSPIDGVKNALDRVRSLGIPVAVVTNQSGIARGLLTRTEVDAVNARVEELLGPFAGFFICPHERADGCSCRKPQPELLLKAAAEIGVDPADCVMVGDIGADVDAALAAGMRAFCVPTAATRADEIAAAPAVFAHFSSTVDAILGAVR